MRHTLLLLALALAACGTTRTGLDGGRDGGALTDGSTSMSDTGIADMTSADTGMRDLGSLDLGALDLGVPDLGSTDLGSPDLGGADSGAPDLGAPDLGVADLGTPDLGVPDLGVPDLGAPDAGPPASRYVLGAPGDNCDMTCAALGLVCGRPPGSVGLQCAMHTDLATCNDPANWIYRYNPGTKPLPYCLAAWGTSDVCNNNYNASNAFCCHCI